MASWFDSAWFRFGLSGTLIALYGVADWLARRYGTPDPRAEVPSPSWVRVAILVSVTAYYLLIRPFGGALAGGWANALGIAVALLAMALRWRVRHGAANLRHPAIATRMLFYAALPLAVGVLPGWLALTLPACALSVWAVARAGRSGALRTDALRSSPEAPPSSSAPR